MDISIVIPVRNEAPNIAPLVAEIRAALDGGPDYEIVYVDDGSSDGTAAAVRDAGRRLPAPPSGAPPPQLRPERGDPQRRRGGARRCRSRPRRRRPERPGRHSAPLMRSPAPRRPSRRCSSRACAPSGADTLVKRLSSRIANARAGAAARAMPRPIPAAGSRCCAASIFLALPYLRPLPPLPAGAGAAPGRAHGVGAGEPSAAPARHNRITASSTGCGSASSISAA